MYDTGFPWENHMTIHLRHSGSALLLLAGSLISGCGQITGKPAAAPPAPPPPEVSVSAVLAEAVTDYEDFPGRLEAINSIEIKPRVTGFLSKINFKEGSIVKKGEILFEIDDRKYKAELDSAEGNAVQMDGRKKRLDADYNRAVTLLDKAAISREEYDKIVGDRTEADGNLKIAKAKQEMAKLNLDWTKVDAPLTGRISRRFVDPGNLVLENQTILTTIVDFDPIYAYFDLDERTTLRYQKLIHTKKIEWSLDTKLPVYLGLADEQDFPHKGAIHFADNRVDPDTGTWRLRGVFANPNEELAAGLFVRIRLPIGTPYTAKLVAEQALGTDQGQKFVYVVDKANKVAYRRVVAGRLHKGLRAISEGLEEGEKVIVSGLQRARPGIEVTPVEVPMRPTKGK